MNRFEAIMAMFNDSFQSVNVIDRRSSVKVFGPDGKLLGIATDFKFIPFEETEEEEIHYYYGIPPL